MSEIISATDMPCAGVLHVEPESVGYDWCEACGGTTWHRMGFCAPCNGMTVTRLGILVMIGPPLPDSAAAKEWSARVGVVWRTEPSVGPQEPILPPGAG